jgi:hypothetical protein
LLAPQFIVKFTCSIKDRATKTATLNCIKKMVARFFDRSSPVSASELSTLEQLVGEAVKSIPDEVLSYKKSFADGNRPRVRPDVPSLPLDPESSKSKSMALPSEIKNEWAALTIANAIDYEENKTREKQKNKKKMEEQRKYLDKLSDANKEKQQQERQREMDDRDVDRKRHEEWLAGEERLKEKKKQEHDELKKMYADQIETRRQLKEKEMQRLKAEADKEVQSLSRQMHSSASAAAKMKAEEKQRCERSERS